MSIADYAEDAVLDALFNNTSLAIAATYVQLHTDDPGEDGTANVATETGRQSADWDPAAGGAVALANDLEWLAVAGTETYTHLSIWDAATDGNCVWTLPLDDPVDVNAGNNFVITSGNITLTLD
jgi:hypothetical protein